MDIAIVVNLRARRGSERVLRTCRDALPQARVVGSSSLEDADGFARDVEERRPSLVVSAGGDGTAVALINAMRRRAPEQRLSAPPFGVIPLGTGNAWANATGAPPWRDAIRKLGRLTASSEPLPLRRFDLVEVGGVVAPFAGTGWDAEIIDDFHAQKTGFGLLPSRYRHGVAGYMHGLFTRTIPRHIGGPKVEVEVVNTGDDAIGVDEHGRAVPLRDAGRGAVLYRGPVSVCAAGTTPEWGFRFRAFPFAGLVSRRFCFRIYGGSALEATMRMRALWQGAHPVPKMHTWMLTSCRATFSHPVPFQAGGDRLGHRSEVEYVLARDQVDLLDWTALAA